MSRSAPPALARPLRGGGSRRSTAAWAGSRRGARRWTRWRGCWNTRYWDLTAKHFHEKLVADHGFKRSYNWLRLSLQAHGRRRAAPTAPAQAAAPRPLMASGRLEPWVPGRWWDLIVTMDDATSDIYSAEGTMSSFQGVSETIRAKGLFCSLYADRASHYWNTPGPAAWTRTPRPRSAAPWRSSASS